MLIDPGDPDPQRRYKLLHKRLKEVKYTQAELATFRQAAGKPVIEKWSKENQGTFDATTFEVTDYIPTGFVLNDAAWTDNGDGTWTLADNAVATLAEGSYPTSVSATSPAC